MKQYDWQCDDCPYDTEPRCDQCHKLNTDMLLDIYSIPNTIKDGVYDDQS